MEQDEYEKIFGNMPIQQKDVAKAYMENCKHIKTTMERVLDRELDDSEKERLRIHSFNLALTQVAKDYNDNMEESKANEDDDE
jgi:hypothetical protein